MRITLSILLAIALSGSGQSLAAEPLRPPEAPLLDLELPPPPPEYLYHDAEGIHFLYHPSARERVRTLIEEAPEVRAELSSLLGVEVLRDVEVRVAVGPGDFARVVPEDAPRDSDILALSDRRVLVISLPSAPISSSEVGADFRRGLAYLALDEATGEKALPRWFRIGFAHHLTGGGEVARYRALWWASMERRIVPLGDLDWYLTEPPGADSIAGAEAADFVAFLLARDGSFPLFVEAIRKDESFEHALAAGYQSDLAGLEQEWRRHVARHKSFLPILIAGTALWVLLALVVQLRRRWRRRTATAEERPARRVGVVRARPAREKRTPKVELPEPEVPKVSHNGRWHTLH